MLSFCYRWRAVAYPTVAAFALLAPAVAAGASPAAAGAANGGATTGGSTVLNAAAHRGSALAEPVSATLPAGVYRACPKPARRGQMECLALVDGKRATGGPGVQPAYLVFPYGPADLRSAYGLETAAANGGTGVTVAIVDATGDPHAAADLATYRAKFGLPPCDPDTGAGCVTTVNEHGQASPLPGPDPSGGWTIEESLDMEMVTAICPNCHILLVEANTPFGAGNVRITDLGAAENTAARMAKFVSNSWGGLEFLPETAWNRYFNHPGVAVTFSGGDFGGQFGPSFPATSSFVTSVGGTRLLPASGTARGWAESAWSGTGSGCSAFQAKPAWQADTGCAGRTDNDLAAVADPQTPVWAYDSNVPLFGDSAPGWIPVGGTSVAAPIIAATYSLAGSPAPGTYPAIYPALHHAAFNDVTSGSNGTCSPAYLCTAEPSYDGPTGWGTPDGATGLAAAGTEGMVTVANPGNQSDVRASKVRLKVRAIDATAGQSLTFSATGLPAALSIDPATGIISGTLSRTLGTAKVTVTATDSLGSHGSAHFRWVVHAPFNSAYPATGRIATSLGGIACADDPGFRTANGTVLDMWSCNGGRNQRWTMASDGSLRVLGKCMDVRHSGTANGTLADLWSCNGTGAQQWRHTVELGMLVNPRSGACLNGVGFRKTNGTKLDIYECDTFTDTAFWHVPAGPVLSAVAAKCMDDPAFRTANGTRIEIWTCNGGSNQRWRAAGDGTIKVLGKCLDVYHSGVTDGTPVDLYTCNYTGAQQWVLGPADELINPESGKCLDDPGDSAVNGTKLILRTCSKAAGESWLVG